MTKKAIIISIVSVVVVALGVFGVLFFIKGGFDSDNQVITPPKPGDSVSLDQTPTYKSCELFSMAAIQEGLGSGAQSIKPGERSGVVALNYEVADRCSFSFATSASEDNTLDVMTYLYSTDVSHSQAEIYDDSWRNISKTAVPAYTLSYPAYFKKITSGDTTAFVLQVIGGAKNYRLAIEQPSGNLTLNETTALNALISLANKANYSVANPTDVPPAPKV
jgi:hypothetical protein